MLFQTGDDIIGIFGDPIETGKSNYGDIVQAKKTVPMYYTYKNATEQERKTLNTYLGKRDITNEEALAVRDLVEKRGLADTQALMSDYAGKCSALLEKVDLTPNFKQFLEGLIEYLQERNH